MRREAFGPLAALSDADLARALVAIGVSSFRLPGPMSIQALVERHPISFRRREHRKGEQVLDFTVSVAALQRYAVRHRNVVKPNEQWQRLFQGATPPPTRYCLDLAGLRNDPDRQVDLDWLAALLSHESTSSVSVFAAWPSEPLSLEWGWPLRIGIAPGPSAAGFRELVERCGYRELFTLVELESAEARCDLLMFPSSLRDAMRSALELPFVRASAVLVLGGLDIPWVQASPWLSSLRHQFHSGAVGTCFVPSIERGAWFQGLVEALSHNMTLDCAMFQASTLDTRQSQAWRYPEAGSVSEHLTAPFILADRDFLDSTRVAETAKRIGAAAAAIVGVAEVEVPDVWKTSIYPSSILKLRNAGEVVVSIADSRPWHHESGDATALKQFRRKVEGIMGASLVLPSIVVGLGTRKAAFRPPRDTYATGASQDAIENLRISTRRMRSIRPTPAGDVRVAMAPSTRIQPPRREQRSVQLDVFRADNNTRVSEVEPSTSYRTSVLIGAGRQGAIHADVALDENLLPPSSVGHQIRMVFTPLWMDAGGVRPVAQVQEVHLPGTGASGRAQFHFTAPKELGDFRVRLVLLNQYRVLQTLLLLCAPEAGSSNGTLSLKEENIVSVDYGDATVAPPFEAALIVNDSSQGVTGLTAIADGGAQFFEPAGFDKILQLIRDDLGSLNAPEGEAESDEVIIGMDDERVHELMYRLALRGAALAKELKRQAHLGAFMSAPRLQVVDAVSGAYFPVELIYDGKAPVEGAKRCERSIDALNKQSVHDECPNRASSEHICPAAFWGFSKCIERQPSNGQQGYGFAHPGPSNNAIRPLKSVLFGASRKVRQVDIVPPAGLESVFTGAGMGFGQAKTWSDWTTKIGSDAPSMLVLLPHSLNSTAAADLPALEIGGTEMPSVRMDETFVHGVGDERPVVLLLGCSTALSDIPFLSFVREFRYNGAAVTVGTLATIRGRQTVEFIKEFLKQLKKVAEEDLTFDEAILRVKRQMLAKGDPFVLSLVAYGDTGWRVHL